MNEVTVTKITGTTFSLSGTSFNFVYAVKVAGDNAYKEVRAAMVYGASGQLEFENNLSEFNLYKGEVPSSQFSQQANDMKLKINFIGGMNTIVTCPEITESNVPISIDDWPIVYQFNSE